MSWLVASALQAGVGAVLAALPVWEGSVGPFLRVGPPLLGGFLYGWWAAGREVFQRLLGGALVGGLSTLAGTLLVLALGRFRLGAAVVIVSATGAGVVAGLVGGAVGGLRRQEVVSRSK